jgi:fission process protein 1
MSQSLPENKPAPVLSPLKYCNSDTTIIYNPLSKKDNIDYKAGLSSIYKDECKDNQNNCSPNPSKPSLFKEWPEDYNVIRYIQSAMGRINPQMLMRKMRPLAYASEVGESFRPLVNPWIVKALYGLSIGYCFVDTGIHTANVWRTLVIRNMNHQTIKTQPRFKDLTPSVEPSVLPVNGAERYVETDSETPLYPKLSDNQMKIYTAVNFADRAFWHTWASMILPAFTIHQIVKYSEMGIRSGLSQMNSFKPSNPLKIPHSKHNISKFLETLTSETDKTKVIRLLKYSRVGSTVAGLCSIPFIIHPLDHGVDLVMDTWLRPLYAKYLVNVNTAEAVHTLQ